jgi:hypothetical protein
VVEEVEEGAAPRHSEEEEEETASPFLEFPLGCHWTLTAMAMD